ncbi:MAG: peptide chain release factor-like protein [Candidatus Omnitrophica bacterium]|nr:peptide chain release factor-like protein [Candidatus Omnitrophota bacterium]MCM8802782.1 peptide chain release factor-like protein [Candidatus Omnitrophota bacterium]
MRYRRSLVKGKVIMKKEEIKIYYYKSRGPGGQRKNKKLTSVKIIHIPTGITAKGTEFRSQAKNKQIALKRLEEKLNKLQKGKKQRIKTEKPLYAKIKQIEEKRKRSEKKKLRQKIREF